MLYASLWLSQLPRGFFSLMPALEHLNLACNTLRVIPTDLASCQLLVTLLLAGNELHHLPEGLGALSQLEVMDLTLNHYEGLPGELSGLTALTQLQLSWNHLREVPQWVGELRSLKVRKGGSRGRGQGAGRVGAWITGFGSGAGPILWPKPVSRNGAGRDVSQLHKELGKS